MNIFQSAIATLTGVVKGVVEASGIAPSQKATAHSTLDTNLAAVLAAGEQDFAKILGDIGQGNFKGALVEAEQDAPQLLGEAAGAVAGIAVEQIPVVGAIAEAPASHLIDTEVTDLVQHFLTVFAKKPEALSAIVASAVPATHG